MESLILTALYELYDRLLKDPTSGVAKPGYSEGSAVAAFELNQHGHLVRAVPLGTQKGKNVVGLRLILPERVKRTAGDAPNFMSDSMEYLIGVRPGSSKPDARSTRRRTLCQRLHETILDSINDEGAVQVLRFLSIETESLMRDPNIIGMREILDKGGNIVFRLQGDDKFIHERPAVMSAWESYQNRSVSSQLGQCLVTGEWGPVAILHKSTSGIAGGQPTGASLVSFNIGSAESYGKEQGANSPVSVRAAFAYGTALNWLTSNKRHHVIAGDTTILFWAERPGPEENLLLQVFAGAFGADDLERNDPPGDTQGAANDEARSQRLKGTLERVFRGQMPTESGMSFDDGTQFYILGLAPNVARLSVRFWTVNTLGGVLENLRQHFEDMAIVHRDSERAISVPRLLMELAPAAARKRESVPKSLVGALMRSILEGTAYPQSLYATLIERIRVDSNDPDHPNLERKVNYPRAAYIKAHLKRSARIAKDKTREEELTEVLNAENRNPGYLLGRLFALLEKAQQDANPGINATIKDRYYASASSTPGSVFPLLMRLTQHHLSKSEYGRVMDKRIEGVVALIDAFPSHLTLEQQGQFALGYYQQKSALFVKSDHQKGGEDNDESRG